MIPGKRFSLAHMVPSNPFNMLLDKFQNSQEQANIFIGVYLNKSGHIRIMRDSAGKLIWYKSVAILHAEFLRCMTTNPQEFQACDFYAISGPRYTGDKLLLNLYETAKIKVTSTMLLIFNAVELDFHRKASVGMYMPLQFNLDNLYAKVQKDPSVLFEVAARAKHLIFNESKPCVSCGILCHVPDITGHPGVSSLAHKELMRIEEENKNFCFDCGKTLIANTAKYKMLSCSDFNKVNTVTALVADIEKLSAFDTPFDFDKAQNILREIMQHISKSSMLILDGDTVIRQEKPKSDVLMNIKNAAVTKPSEIPPYMN